LALFFLLLVFFIIIVAIALFVFPPSRIVAWLDKGSRKP
jgi:hypothetical protein